MSALVVVQKAISPVLNLLEVVRGVQEESKDIPSSAVLEANTEPYQQDRRHPVFEGYNDQNRSEVYHGYRSWRWQPYHPYLGLGWPSDFDEDAW